MWKTAATVQRNFASPLPANIKKEHSKPVACLCAVLVTLTLAPALAAITELAPACPSWLQRHRDSNVVGWRNNLSPYSPSLLEASSVLLFCHH